MDFTSIIGKIGGAAKAVLGAIVPGGAEMVKAATSIIGLIDSAKETFGSPADVLNKDREALEAFVNDHEKRTSASLG